MVESSRRHGHYDPRFGPSRRKSHLRLVPAPDVGVNDRSNDDGLDAWEEEGGQPAAFRAPAVQPPELDWEAFSREFFPGRRRHDFEVVKAYEVYRATGALPATEPDHPAPRDEAVAVAVAVAVSLPR